MKKLIIFILLALYSCSTPKCDNLVEYYEQFPVYTYIDGKYEFIAYTSYTQVMSTCDCLRAANNEAGNYYDRLEGMEEDERELHDRYPSYYECR